MLRGSWCFLSVYSICAQMEGYLFWSFRKVPQYIMDPMFQSRLQHCHAIQNESIKCHCLKYVSSFLSPKFILFLRPKRSHKSPENLPWLYSPNSAFILFILSLIKHLLSVYYMPTTLPGSQYAVVKRQTKSVFSQTIQFCVKPLNNFTCTNDSSCPKCHLSKQRQSSQAERLKNHGKRLN